MADKSETWDESFNRSCSSAAKAHSTIFMSRLYRGASSYDNLVSLRIGHSLILSDRLLPLGFQDVPASRKNIKHKFNLRPRKLCSIVKLRETSWKEIWNSIFDDHRLLLNPPTMCIAFYFIRSSFPISQCLETTSLGTQTKVPRRRENS